MANAITYIRNVGKSVGYASFDVLKEMNPVFSDFAETNGELVSDMYKSIRNLKKKSKDLPNKIMESEYGKFAKTYRDNLFDDLKSGKFYNKERKDRYESEAADIMMGTDDFGFEDDNDFNFDDMGSFDDDELSTNDMMDIVGEKTSNAINNTLARSAEYIVQGTAESNKAIYNQITNIYGGLHTGLATINQNISKMIEFHSEGTATHYENARTFFQESTRLDQERNQYLKEISESLKSMNGPEQKSSKTDYRKNTYSDMVSYEGVLDISRYGQNIKKNIKDKSGGVFDMLNMMIETGMLNTIAASPLEGLVRMMVGGVLPSALKKSMDNLNKSLSGMTGNALLGMKNKAKESMVWETISEIFGVNTSIQTKLDPSKYEKGKIPFDGVTKKAIVEVIPTYLSKILAAVSGGKEDRFNYDTGKFVTIDELRSEFNDLTKTSANRAAYGIDSVIRDKTRKLGWDKDQQRQFDEDWEAIKEYMFKNQRNFNTKDRKLRGKSFGLKGGVASDTNVRLLQEILDGNPEMLRYADQLFKEIDTHNRRMVDYQNSGTMTALANGSVREPSPVSGTSAYAATSGVNSSIISELVAIHKELSYIRLYGTGRSGSKKGGPRPKFDKFNIPEPRIGNYNQYDKDINKNASDHYDTLSDEELDKRVSGILATGKDDTKTDTKHKTFSERMHEASTFSAKMSVLVQSASDLAKKPGEFVVAMMDKADARLYDIIYGPKEDKEGNKSFLGRLFNNLNKMFDKFSEFVTDTIIEPLKGKFTKEDVHNAAKKFFGIFGIDLDETVKSTKEFLFGKENGFFTKFTDSFKSEMKGAFGWVKNAFKDVGDWAGFTSKKKDKPSAVDTIISGLSNTTEAASGLKRVNKTGLAVISEGEMILPPDMNPFNVSKRKRNEKNFKRDLISSIANADEYAEGKDENGNKFNREEYERLPFWVRMTDAFTEGSTKFFEQLSQNIGLNKEDTDKFKDNAVDFIGKIKEYGGTMAAGATIGAGVSVLTGLIGGPLVGAAVGAGIGLIKKSETVQNMLFGEIDEKTGERAGSKFISKDLANNINKYLPDMAKGATVGGILTALPFVPGGPVAGVILGSALGFAKNNEKVQESLFGPGKFLGTKEQFQKKVQSVLPKMGVGALAGLLAGPFGLTTNLVLGSALGFASDTDKFKNLMFGELKDGKRNGGIFGSITKPAKEFFDNMYADFKEFIQTDMLNPLRKAIEPIKKQFEIMGDHVKNLLSDTFKKHIGLPIERALKEYLINPLGKFFSGLFKLLMKPIKTVVSAPFKLVGSVGDSLRKHQIKIGKADYMTAEERIAFRKSKGWKMRIGDPRDKYAQFDESLANMDDEGLGVATDALGRIKNARSSFQEADVKSFNRIKSVFDADESINRYIRRTALKLLKKNGHDAAKEFINANVTDPESKNKLLNVITTESIKMQNLKTMRADTNSSINKVAEQLKELGFNISPSMLKRLSKGDKEANKIYDMLAGEQNIRNKRKEKDTPENLSSPDAPVTESKESKRHDEIKNRLDNIIKLIEERIEISKGLDKQQNAPITDPAFLLPGPVAEDSETNMNLRQKITIGRYKVGKFGRTTTGQVIRGVKKGARVTRGAFSAARDNNIANTILGDRNENYYDGYIPEVSKHGKHKDEFILFVNDIRKNIKKLLGVTVAQAHADGTDVPTDDRTVTSGNYIDRIKNKFKSTKETITQFVNGIPLRFKKDNHGKYDHDIGDPKTKEFIKKENEKEKREEGILGALTNMPNTLGGIFGKIFGKKSEEEKSWFDKIIEKIGTPVKIAAATATAFGVLGWAQEKIFPGLKTFWDQSAAPYLNEAWQGKKEGFGQFIYFFNPQNPNGLLEKFKEYFPRLMQTAATYISSGMNWALQNVLPTVVSTLIQNLPVILKGFGTGLLDGFNKLLFHKGEKNDGRMTDLENIESQLGSSSPFSGMTPTSTPSWFDKNVNIGNTKTPLGRTLTLSSTTTAKNINIGIVDRPTLNTNTSAIPKAFDTMNQAYRTPAIKEYEKVKSNVIETPYGPMTVGEILNSDKQFATNTETGEAIYGYEMLNYNNTAQQLGMNIQLSEQEMRANTLAQGGGDRTTVQGKLGAATLRSFTRGLVGNSTGVTKGANFVNNSLGLIGKVTKIIPGFGKPIGAAIEGTGELVSKGIKFPNELGKKISGKTVTNVAEAVTEAATDTKTGAFSKFVKKAANSALGKFIASSCEATKGLLKESKVAQLISQAVIHVKGSTSISVIKSGIDKFGDFLVDRLPTLLREHGGKLGGKAAAKLTAYTASAATLLVADAVISFMSGYKNANSILGITQQPDIPYKVICGILEALNSVLCLGLVPLNVLVDLVLSGTKLLGLDGFDKIEKQRELAQEEVAKYNKEYGTDFSIEEYNKRDSLGSKVKNVLNTVGNWFKNTFSRKDETDTTSMSVDTPTSAASNYIKSKVNVSNVPSYAASSNAERTTTDYGRGSGLYVGRGSAEDRQFVQAVKRSREEELKNTANLSRGTFISQIDSRYRDQQFNISGDTERQTLGDTGCAPAAAAMAINSSLGGNQATMEDSSRFALKYKVKNDGVNATYFNDEFARHGVNAKYITSPNTQARSQEIMRQLAENNKVVLMGEDDTNTSKANSPFGPNAHYVVANGLSEDGKFVYINDPEARTPNIKYPTDKVLGSSKLGIAANVARGSRLITNKLKNMVGRGTLPGKDTAEKCWNYFRSHGFSDEATAGILGNLKAESGMDPTRLQNGRGPAAGICQMETYGKYNSRWGKMAKLAESRGRDWTDLESQLDFMLQDLPAQFKSFTGKTHTYPNGTVTWWPQKMTLDDFKKLKDVAKATEIFERVFERPSIPHREKRIKYAKEYYNKFSGKYTPVDGSSSTDASGGTTAASTPLGEILGVFSGLAQAWGVTPANTTDTASSYESVSGPASGNVSSNPTFAEQQKSLVNKMYSVKGKLKYAQDNARFPGSRNPDDGSGDCSSTVRWAYRKVLGVDPGSWTGAQRTDTDTYTVATSNWKESDLQLGDLLLKLNPGHVEMYAGNGQMIGHGSGYGPKVKKLGSPSTYSLVRRWKGFKGAGSGLTDFIGRGSETVAPNGAYDNALKHIKHEELTSILPLGYDNEEISKNKTSVMQYSNNKLNDTNKINKTTRYVGRASQVTNEIKVVNKPDVDMVELVKAILRLLVQVVTNTDQLNNIASLLGEYITKANSSDGSKESKEATLVAKQNLINAMQSGNNNASNSRNSELMALIEATERIARE